VGPLPALSTAEISRNFSSSLLITRIFISTTRWQHVSRRGRGGAASFPAATYVVQQRELEFARHTNERTAASYLRHNFDPITFRLIDGEAEVLPGIRCLPTPGHVPFHQSVLVESGGERACFLADLVPTSAHLPLPWIMGYDLEPLVTLESKRRLYARAEAEGWLLWFEHDPRWSRPAGA